MVTVEGKTDIRRNSGGDAKIKKKEEILTAVTS